jgi:hypothetical protein
MKKRKIKSVKPEPPLGLDMPFDEALRRFIGVDPKEVEASVKRAQKKKLGDKKEAPSAIIDDVATTLPDRPVRKRKYGS